MIGSELHQEMMSEDPYHVPLSERRELCNANVTLAGRPATISNYKGSFAIIRTLDGMSGGEWAWPTARKIIRNGGAFKL